MVNEKLSDDEKGSIVTALKTQQADLVKERDSWRNEVLILQNATRRLAEMNANLLSQTAYLQSQVQLLTTPKKE